MTPFQSLRDYEEFVYTLQKQFPSILQSTLVLVPRGRRIAILQGDILFEHGFRLSIKERLSDDMGRVAIEAYGYEMWRDAEKISWYDAQPHPDVPAVTRNRRKFRTEIGRFEIDSARSRRLNVSIVDVQVSTVFREQTDSVLTVDV